MNSSGHFQKMNFPEREFLYLGIFQVRCTCNDWKFSFLPFSLLHTSKSWQTNQSVSYSNNFNNINKEFLPKSSSQKAPPKKILLKKFLPKHFYQKNPPEKFLPKNFSQKSLKKFSQQIQKISKQFFKKILRFWNHPIPYIALRGRKPFRACFFIFLTVHRGVFCQFSFQWIYYCNSSKSTGKKTGKTHLCAMSNWQWRFHQFLWPS